MTARCPRRSTSCGAFLDIGMTIVAIGRRATALSSAL